MREEESLPAVMPMDLRAFHGTLGVHSTTTAFELLQRLSGNDKDRVFFTIKPYNHNEELFSALKNGDVDGVLYDHARSKAEELSGFNWTATPIDYETLDLVVRPEEYVIGHHRVNTLLRDQVDEILRKGKKAIQEFIAKRDLPGTVRLKDISTRE